MTGEPSGDEDLEFRRKLRRAYAAPVEDCFNEPLFESCDFDVDIGPAEILSIERARSSMRADHDPD